MIQYPKRRSKTVSTQAVSRKVAPPTTPIQVEVPALVQPVVGEQQAEVLAFLRERPTHTVMLAGLIRDNGLVSSLNRGTFYECRSAGGDLEGIMIVGEIVMFEARTDRCLKAFAHHAQSFPDAYMIIGEHEKIADFWNYYGGTGQEPRLFCQELLFELRWPVDVLEAVPELRLAKPSELDHVVRVHAEMALEESGIDPLQVDPVGFHERCLRRIEQGRVWIWMDKGRVVFKADVISETPDVIYLEGVYTDPDERGKGIGTRCLSQLSRDLLSRTKCICLLANEKNRASHEMYRKCRYRHEGLYDTIFLQKANTATF
jgi:GNAT superfamily N-acetyltransferase